MTNLERYLAAATLVAHACEALDEAAGLMKKARIEAQAAGYRKPTMPQLVIDAGSLLEDLRAATCEDCGNPLDADLHKAARPAGEILAVCQCDWLHKEVR